MIKFIMYVHPMLNIAFDFITTVNPFLKKNLSYCPV